MQTVKKTNLQKRPIQSPILESKHKKNPSKSVLLTCHLDVIDGVGGGGPGPVGDEGQLAKVAALLEVRDLDLAGVLLDADRHLALLDEVHPVGDVT